MLLHPKNPKNKKLIASICGLVLLAGIVLLVALYTQKNRPAIKATQVPFDGLEIPIMYPQREKDNQGVRPEDETTILFAGDIMLDRYVRVAIQKNGLASVFNSVDPLLDSYDAVTANLEGCFTDFVPRPLDPNSLAFTFDPSLVSELASHNFSVFSLANNHALNFGEVGLSQCKSYLEKESIFYFGNPKNTAPLSTSINIKNHTFGFVGYNALERTSVAEIVAEIEALKDKTDFIVVMPHWGNEYHTSPSAHQTTDAHTFIDAGADLILGAHPHVIQPLEQYKEKYIFYSLGNFIFDQTFSDETQTGLLIGAHFSDAGIAFDIFPMSNKKFQIILLEGKLKNEMLSGLADKSIINQEVKENLKRGVIQI